jgi:hypothetical protein
VVLAVLLWAGTAEGQTQQWTKYVGNPVLEHGEPGDWDAMVDHSEVIFDGAIYRMWYAGGLVSHESDIGYATSTDGVHWNTWPGHPVLLRGAPGEWDVGQIQPGAVIWDGTLFHRWYGGCVSGELGPCETGYATFSHGWDWTKHPANPVAPVGDSGSWDCLGAFIMAVVADGAGSDIRFDLEGRFVFVVALVDGWIAPLDGGPAREAIPAVDNRQIEQGAISPSGARVASAYFIGKGPFELYVVDVTTGARKAFDLPWIEDEFAREAGVISLEFLDEETLLTMGGGGLRRWDLTTGANELMVPNDGRRWMKASPSAGVAVAWGMGADLAPPVELIDLVAWTSRPLPGFEGDVEWADLDPSGKVVAAGSTDGVIRVGRVDGGEPQLLLGHTAAVTRVAISPDLKWVASAGEDDTLRLWPMPDLSKPPLHTLPHDELIAKLHSLTNLRAVRDPESSTGWTIELGPFPGWRDVPTW